MHLSAVFFSAQSLTKQTTNLPEKQFAIDKFYVISSQGFTNFLFCTKSLTKQTTNLPEKEFAIVKFHQFQILIFFDWSTDSFDAKNQLH